MTEQHFTGHTIYGTLGGIITIFLVNISAGDLLKTALLSAVGAVVSISVSLVVKCVLRKWHK
jgi:hypothetical protein